MTVSIVFTIGTPSGQWPHWVGAIFSGESRWQRMNLPAFSAWCAALPEDDNVSASSLTQAHIAALESAVPADSDAVPWGGMDGRACWALDLLARRFPGAHYIAFIESPAVGLAAALERGCADDPDRWVSTWCKGAERVLQHVQRYPDRCLVVDAEEARLEPQAFVDVCVQRLGLSNAFASTLLPAAEGDLLSQSLGATLAFSGSDAKSLLAELQASCVYLSHQTSSVVSESPALRIDAPAIALRLKEVYALQSHAEVTAQEIAVLHEEREKLKEALAENTQLSKRVEASDAERQDQSRLLAELRSEVYTLGQIKAELEVAVRSQHTFIDSLKVAKSEAERDAAERADEVLRLTEERARDTPDASEQSRLSMDAIQRDVELQSARSDLDAARNEIELRALQIRQIQEELDYYHSQYYGLDAAANASANVNWSSLSIGEVLLGPEHYSPPYLNLNFTLRRVKLHSSEVAECAVRLVEHRGHPGLVIFAGSPGARMIQGWRETGREGEHPYALVMPSDLTSHPVLQALDSLDWLLIKLVVARLRDRLEVGGQAIRPLWAQVARRLHEELLELPSCFRYKTVEIERLLSKEADTLVFRFGHVDCGCRRLQRLTVYWRYEGSDTGLTLVRDSDFGAPLPSWPDSEDGVSPDQLRFPMGVKQRASPDFRNWDVLGSADRQFVLALVVALPEAVSRISPSVLGGGQSGSSSSLVASASALLEDARQALGLPPLAVARGPKGLLGRAARRLMGRHALFL